MIKEIINALSKSIKNSFKERNIWEHPVYKGYSDGDFVVAVESLSSSPKPNGVLLNTVTLSILCNCEKNLDFCDVLVGLEQAVDIIELDNGIILRAMVTENKIEKSELKLKLAYSFYSYNSDAKDLMERINYEQI